ncbi:aminodeoxychorismate synthase component I [Actinomadura macrotermitis]|uniref:aminodeoxychorismate synthase n=1 Tax=Actinomadura macrotermitis TaxID=2585200 RepID=A0A7K0BZ55_9ACTN|nr:aminodeoxychorismate synthase component I [Actinomadura macrotermitis]MQY06457.1 Isochorismate synthase MenF [Actinomadura macrotermitis]
MRTLLIDNHDSYTYNLFQLIAGVLGEEPAVITNDQWDEADLDLAAFDNVVVSPGPGRPDRERDMGLSATAIARADIPLLGVCLGHQGVVVDAGGRVDRAPAARHGHLTKVSHDGDALFRGLPPVFTAVRYHSLCARQELPPTLEATAWAEDGVVMGLRHRHRPLWGVQFHPESVASEHGAEIVANFRDLTREHQRATGRAPVSIPVRGPDRSPERTAPEPAYRLRHTAIDREVDTEAAFQVLFAAAPRAFWLDSSHVEPGLARFSYLGDDRGPLSEHLTYSVDDGAVRVRSGDGPPAEAPGTIFDHLAGALRERTVPESDTAALPFDFTGGYVGYFGYELKADLGADRRYRAETPDAAWLFADRLVAVDHQEGRTYALALYRPDRPGSEADAEAWLERTAATLRTLDPPRRDGPPPAREPGRADVEALLTRDREQYLADVRTSQDRLHAGESYEICLTNAATLPARADGPSFYRALRRVNPAPYGSYLRFDDVEVACSSPERFLRVTADRWAETKPIKGTAPRGATPAEDRELRDTLAGSAKTRAENLMIVDLLRNDLGRVCEIGSVHVPRLMAVESYATVHQLVSTIRGRLRPEVDVIDCVRACFPGGSMTGAPKRRTLEIIDSLETEARGVYSGAIGFLGCRGTADLNIVIRTAVRSGGVWRVGAGGAIVLDSDPADEYEEMLLKLRATLRAGAAAESAESAGRTA